MILHRRPHSDEERLYPDRHTFKISEEHFRISGLSGYTVRFEFPCFGAEMIGGQRFSDFVADIDMNDIIEALKVLQNKG
jgi:hypothetical protein